MEKYESYFVEYIDSLNIEKIYENEYYNLAIKYKEIGDYINSIKFFLATLKLNTSHYLSYYNLGLIYKEKGNYLKAINYFESCLEYLKDSTSEIFINSYFEIANIFIQIKDFKKAIFVINAIIDIFPFNSKAYSTLALVYHHENNIDASLNAYKKAYDLNPNNYDAIQGISLIEKIKFST